MPSMTRAGGAVSLLGTGCLLALLGLGRLLTAKDPHAAVPGEAKQRATRPRPTWELQGHERAVTCAIFSADGKQLATGTDLGEVLLWDVAKGKRLRRLEMSDAEIEGLAFSPDGRRLAVVAHRYGKEGGLTGAFEVAVWEVVSAKPLFSRVLWPVYGLLFSPDGKFLVVDRGKRVDVTEAHTGKTLSALGQNSGRTCGLMAFAPKGKQFAVGDSYELRVYDFPSGKAQFVLKNFASTECHLRFGPQGHTLLTIHGDNKLRSWDAVTGKLLSERKWSKVTVWRIWSRGLSGDWRRAACAAGEADKPLLVMVFDVQTGRLRLWIPPANKHEAWFDGVTVALSPDGRWLATAASDGLGLVELWDLNALPKKK